MPWMRALFIVALFVPLAIAVWCLWPRPVELPKRGETPADPEGRVARARERVRPELVESCRAAGVAYPPRELFLRAFKREGELEAWARGDGDRFSLVRTFPILTASGDPGPKRREGDRQVPEGFYRIDRFNPLSSYHLSLRVDYPNASDRERSDRERPGFDIYIHGGSQTVGCLPIGDDGIEALYVLADEADNRDGIPVHVFPARMTGEAWVRFAAAHPAHAEFWAELRPGYEAFEESRRLPEISVDAAGRYRVSR